MSKPTTVINDFNMKVSGSIQYLYPIVFIIKAKANSLFYSIVIFESCIYKINCLIKLQLTY